MKKIKQRKNISKSPTLYSKVESTKVLSIFCCSKICKKKWEQSYVNKWLPSLLLWYQICQQIIFKREEQSLAYSLLNIICRQIWYQSKSDYMDRAFGYQKSVLKTTTNFLFKSCVRFIPFSVFCLLVKCPIHVVTFTLISILATDYIQKRRGQALLSSFEYNLLPNLISK